MPENIKLTRRRALAALGVIGAGSAAAGAGTFALFSDTETSGPNNITAGTLDLELDPDGSASTSITLGNIKPTDKGYIAIELGNSGDIGGNIIGINIGDFSGGTFTSSLVVDSENTPNPESEGETDTADGGDLDEFLETQVVVEASADFGSGSEGVNEGSEYTPSGNATTVVADGTTLTNAVGTNDVTDSLGTSETKYLVINYNFPSDANDDDAQGDVAEFDVQIELEQA